MAKFSKWIEICIISSVYLCVVLATNVTDCLHSWDCKWQHYIPFARKEGTCSFIPKGSYPIDGPSTVGPPGPFNVNVFCHRDYGSTSNMFECLKLLAGYAEIKALHLHRCSHLEVKDDDLSYFSSLEEFNVSSTSIRSMSHESFYHTKNLITIDLHQDYYESGVLEYPNALVGPDLSDPGTNETDGTISFLPNLKNLLLHNFRFDSGIPQNAFHNLRMLEHLTFSHVNLRNSDFQSMSFLKNLSHLEIYDSPMIDIFPLDLSSFLPYLVHLELSFTNITTIKTETFSSFSFLETLILSNNLILETIYPQTFAKIEGLRSLSLAHSSRLGIIPSLESLVHLRYIDLSFCAISNLSSTLFAENSNIRRINLKGNKIKIIPNIFQNFENGAVSLEKVEHIDLSKNEIKEIESYAFSNLKYVKSIILSYNQITFVDNHAFYNLESIESVELDVNSLTITGLSSVPFYDISTLKNLDLTFNKLTNFPKFPYVNWEPLGEHALPKNPFRTFLKNNPLTCDCDMFKRMFVKSGKNQWGLSYYHDYVWPGSYQLSNQRFDDVLTCRIFPHHENQRIDDMLKSPEEFFSILDSPDDCPIFCTCFKNCYSNLYFTRCNDVNLSSIPSIINSRTNVLNLKNNTITQLTFNSLIHLPNLQFLDLSGNFISQIENGVFFHLKFLRSISLCYNNLTQISLESLNISSSNFHRLDLSFNFILDIHNDSFSAIPSLVKLNLSDNNLHSLPTGVFDNLKNLTYLLLRGNPLTCTCGILYLTNWYKERVFDIGEELITDITDLLCAPYLNETELINWVEDMEIRCSPPPTPVPVTSIVTVVNPFQWKILIAAVTCAIMLTSLICGLVYKFRLEILVLIYVRTGIKFFGKAHEGKEYDAFISFSSLDREFVLKELVPTLEGKDNHRKLCIHHRDFIVGECIATNIINAIENSSKIIILCSKNYVESDWCSYEFKSAHQQALKDRDERIVFIMMEDVDQNSLDKEIKAYISTNTYLHKKDPLFWSKLDYAIPKSKDCSKDKSEEKVRDYQEFIKLDIPKLSDIPKQSDLPEQSDTKL